MFCNSKHRFSQFLAYARCCIFVKFNIKCMTDPYYIFSPNIFVEHTYPLSLTIRVALIQIFFFFLIIYQNLAPTALIVSPRGVKCMTDPKFFVSPNIFSEHTYTLSSTVRVTPIQIFNILSFFRNCAPTAPMVPPRGVTCMTNPQYFCPPNIFSEHTYALSLPPGGASIRKFYT